MLLKINSTITLATGQQTSGATIQLFNEIPKLSDGKIVSDLQVWASQTDKDDGKLSTYLWHSTNGSKSTNINYSIPQADLDQCVTDGRWGVIGTNFPNYI